MKHRGDQRTAGKARRAHRWGRRLVDPAHTSPMMRQPLADAKPGGCFCERLPDEAAFST
jgi:hypothetical protein